VKEEKRSMGTLRRNIVSAVRDMWSSSLTAQVLLASLALLSGNSLMACLYDWFPMRVSLSLLFRL
jgi:hypothetical protein